MADAVDAYVAAWRRERPDIDTWPMEIVGRIQRLERLLDKRLREFFAGHGLELGEVDVLTTLRRAGEPCELTAGELVRTSMVTSGAITNRIDRMVAKDLVARRERHGDRRTVRIGLTGHGRMVIDEVLGPHIDNEAGLLGALNKKDARDLAAHLRTLLESLGDVAE